MGGYAAYVWPAYGFAVLALVALLVQSWRSAKRRAAELEQLGHLARPRRARKARLRSSHGPDAASVDLSRPATE